MRNVVVFLCGVMVSVVLSVLLGGCLEAGYRMNEMVGLNCRPEVMRQYGSCIATK